jgi:glycosyltransferase involved in cell wall biosynthesis
VEHWEGMYVALKILMVLTYYCPHRTGLTLHVQRLADALIQRGQEVTVLTARHSRRLARDEVINGVRVVRLWAPLRISRGMIMPFFPWAIFRLIRQHDLVSIHTPLLEAGLIAGLASLLGVPLVVTHHGDLILPSGWFNRFTVWGVFQLYRMAAHLAHTIIAYSQDYADRSYYLRDYMDKVVPIYPPIAIPEPDPANTEKLRARLDIEGKKVVGYAGRFVEEKRPDHLLRAIPVIAKTFPNLCVVFAGEYQIQYEDFFQRCAPLIERYEESVRFMGLLRDHQEMADFYRLCDVLALPSGSECLGLVQVESMLCGTPVVTTNIPGARVAVRMTGMGEIVSPHEPAALGEALVRVLQSPEAYVRPRSEIASIFSLKKTIDRYETVFQQAIEDSGG